MLSSAIVMLNQSLSGAGQSSIRGMPVSASSSEFSSVQLLRGTKKTVHFTE